MAKPSAGRSFETDRARFLGRGHGVGAPIAMLDARPLTNSVGTVLDPIFALRRRVRVGGRGDGSRRLLDHGCGDPRCALGLHRQTSGRGGL